MKILKNVYLYITEAFGKINTEESKNIIELHSDEEVYRVIGNQELWDNSILITDDTNIIKTTEMSFLICLNEKNCGNSLPEGAYCIEGLEDLDLEYVTKVFNRFHGIPWKILETERLSIEEISVEDVIRLKELYSNPIITEYMEDLFPIEEEIEYTKNYIKNIYGFYGYGMWLMKLKDTKEIIGRVGIESKDSFEGLELGFMLGRDYWGNGYAYEACKAVIEYAVDELENYDFRAMVHKNNENSKKLCHRLGFTEYAISEDHIDFRMHIEL